MFAVWLTSQLLLLLLAAQLWQLSALPKPDGADNDCIIFGDCDDPPKKVILKG